MGWWEAGGRGRGTTGCCQQMLSQFHGSESVGVGMGTMYLCAAAQDWAQVYGQELIHCFQNHLTSFHSLGCGCSTWSLVSPVHWITLLQSVIIFKKLFCLSFLLTCQFMVIWINVLRGEKDLIRFKRKNQTPGFHFDFSNSLHQINHPSLID